MTKRITLEVSMCLLSDAVFGSGYSDAGGADIAVCKDSDGWPYLRGSAWKGLLRESMENLLAWAAADAEQRRAAEETLAAVMGESGRNCVEDARRVTLTELCLRERPSAPEDCYQTRTFTSLDRTAGTVAAGSLRSAECVCRGLTFVGEAECAVEDMDLVTQALRGIRWAGTMRSRGFGEVDCTVRERRPRSERSKAALSPGHCIRYRLKLESAALMTDLSRSLDNQYETRGYIPGSAVRGLVMGTLAAERPEWFAAHRTEILSDAVRFPDALPVRGELPPIPSVRGFYESKDKTEFVSVLTANPDEIPKKGLKRAKIGEFCALTSDDAGGHILRYWQAPTGGATRISQERNADESGDKDGMFQTQFLLPGQEFEGYILLDDPTLAEIVGAAIPQTAHIGADRFAGFGKCALTLLEVTEASPLADAYGYRDGDAIGETLYMLALSPFAVRDGNGRIQGFDRDAENASPLAQLAEKLGVESLTVEACDTSLAEYGGYNRIWGCHLPAVRMYDRGSVFKLRCGSAPSLDALRKVQAEGIGIRREDGFGQVLFLRETYFDEKTGVRASLPDETGESVETAAAAIRRAKYGWVMENAQRVIQSAMSPSQIGTLQSLCEESARRGGVSPKIDKWFGLNESKNVRHSVRFSEIRQLTETVLETPLSRTLKLSPPLESACMDSKEERLNLLRMLFNYSRREKQDANAKKIGADAKETDADARETAAAAQETNADAKGTDAAAKETNAGRKIGKEGGAVC